jgi:Tfp pilus assembly protein FimT
MAQTENSQSHRQRWKAFSEAARARVMQSVEAPEPSSAQTRLERNEFEIGAAERGPAVLRRLRSKERGISLVEIMIAVAMLGLVVLVAAPAFGKMMKSSRVQGSLRQFVGDVRNARARAASTGWEYKIVGFRAGTGANANKYRLLGRKSGSVTWPVDTAAVATTSTTYAGRWTDFTTLYPGVSLSPGGSTGVSRFELWFAPRGIVTGSTGSFDPFTLNGQSGVTKSFRVSNLGSITIQ